jgi:hypothetical protein
MKVEKEATLASHIGQGPVSTRQHANMLQRARWVFCGLQDAIGCKIFRPFASLYSASFPPYFFFLSHL